MALSPGDPHSYARPEFAIVTRTFLKLFVDFDRTVLRGEVTLAIRRRRTCNEIILDNFNLTISEVTYYGHKFELKYTIEDCNKFGSKLTIQLPEISSENNQRDAIERIIIKYETNQNSPALYWLKPYQTSDGTNPFLISNSKFTYARAIFPCQDTPSVKSAYKIRVSVPLNFTALLPGRMTQNFPESNRRIYFFSHPKVMPSYAMFIVVGSLNVIEINSINIRLWAENKCEYIEQSKSVFGKIECMLQIAKKFCGNHFDDLHDICVLPPNIPEFEVKFSSIIFVSSILLDGEQFSSEQFSLESSLVWSIITRNIVEMCIGNIVICENFEHFWLTKSFSTYISRKIMRYKFGEGMEIFLKTKGINDLKNMIRLYDNTGFLQTLVPNLTDSLPKDIIKYIPYEKGCLLLYYLENLLGGPSNFESYVKVYLESFKYKSINTDSWKNHLYHYFCETNILFLHVLDSVNWDTWFYGLDLSHVLDHFTIVEMECHRLAEQWIAEETLEKLSPVIFKLKYSDDLTRLEFLAYLHASPAVQPNDKFYLLRHAYPVNQLICEIRFLWLRLCIKYKCLAMVKVALEFACHYCMPKFACPIFRDLYEMSLTYELTRTRDLAISLFKDNKYKMLSETVIEVVSILNIDLNDLNE